MAGTGGSAWCPASLASAGGRLPSVRAARILGAPRQWDVAPDPAADECLGPVRGHVMEGQAPGLARICVIVGLLEHSPAEYVRRAPVPAESPTPGLTACNSKPSSPPPGPPPTATTSPSPPCSGYSGHGSS